MAERDGRDFRDAPPTHGPPYECDLNDDSELSTAIHESYAARSTPRPSKRKRRGTDEEEEIVILDDNENAAAPTGASKKKGRGSATIGSATIITLDDDDAAPPRAAAAAASSSSSSSSARSKPCAVITIDDDDDAPPGVAAPSSSSQSKSRAFITIDDDDCDDAIDDDDDCYDAIEFIDADDSDDEIEFIDLPSTMLAAAIKSAAASGSSCSSSICLISDDDSDASSVVVGELMVAPSPTGECVMCYADIVLDGCEGLPLCLRKAHYACVGCYTRTLRMAAEPGKRPICPMCEADAPKTSSASRDAAAAPLPLADRLLDLRPGEKIVVALEAEKRISAARVARETLRAKLLSAAGHVVSAVKSAAASLSSSSSATLAAAAATEADGDAAAPELTATLVELVGRKATAEVVAEASPLSVLHYCAGCPAFVIVARHDIDAMKAVAGGAAQKPPTAAPGAAGGIPCTYCKVSTCVLCNRKEHAGMTCKAAAVKDGSDAGSMHCHKCALPIVHYKNDGCHALTCPVCKAGTCAVCGTASVNHACKNKCKMYCDDSCACPVEKGGGKGAAAVAAGALWFLQAAAAALNPHAGAAAAAGAVADWWQHAGAAPPWGRPAAAARAAAEPDWREGGGGAAWRGPQRRRKPKSKSKRWNAHAWD